MLTETVISVDRKIRTWQYLRDLWEYRDLFRAFLERDLKVRYKQTILGVLWVLIQPLTFAGIFTIIFVRVAQMPTQDLPPMLFYLAALIPWSCFANGISQAAGSLEGNAGLISKVYFPRMIVPCSMILGTVIDFCIGWVFFNGIAILWGYWTWLFLPFTVILLALQVTAVLGIGLILAVLNAQYRDIRYVTPFLIMVGMWVTPVFWPSELLMTSRHGDTLLVFLYLNPMAGVIESYRALLVGNYIPYRMLVSNILISSVVLFSGVSFFRWREQRLIDLL